jgi:hypothetical protein
VPISLHKINRHFQDQTETDLRKDNFRNEASQNNNCQCKNQQNATVPFTVSQVLQLVAVRHGDPAINTCVGYTDRLMDHVSLSIFMLFFTILKNRKVALFGKNRTEPNRSFTEAKHRAVKTAIANSNSS